MNNLFSDLDVDVSKAITVEEIKAEEIRKRAHIVNGGEEVFDCPSCNGKGSVLIGYRNVRYAACFKCKGKGKVGKRVVAAAKAKVTREQNLANKQLEFYREFKAEYEFICANMNWSKFYRSMYESIMMYGNLTENQMAAVKRGMEQAAEKAAAKKQEREAKGGEVNVSAIEAMFDTARESGLKRLGFRTMEIDISAAKETSSNPGALYVKHDGVYVGKIMNGKFMPTNAAKSDTLAKILEVAANPREKAVQYGKMTGKCSCCGRELTDEISVANGIGPICETKWGF